MDEWTKTADNTGRRSERGMRAADKAREHRRVRARLQAKTAHATACATCRAFGTRLCEACEGGDNAL